VAEEKEALKPYNSASKVVKDAIGKYIHKLEEKRLEEEKKRLEEEEKNKELEDIFGLEIKEEIENAFNEKFTGHQNAGRVMFSWNKNKESATDIVEPKLEDFGERYKALSTHSRQQIFAAFRAVPALFGIMTESTGFNEQEFSQAFRLYNRTQIRPVQRIIGDAYERIYGVPQPLTIKPFSIEETTTETTVQ
jgi:Arc/MetJ-type ribon-helix-helix transcriptional regulator